MLSPPPQRHSYKVVGSIKYEAPLLSLALSPAGSHLVVGQSDASICVRNKKITPVDDADVPADPYAIRVGRPGQVARAETGGRTEHARPGTYRYFLRGRKHAPQPNDLVLDSGRGLGKLSRFDKGALRRLDPATSGLRRAHTSRLAAEHPELNTSRPTLAALKSFHYHEAFDAALKDGSPEVVVSVVEELVQRNGLRIALQGRDHHTLQPVVAFLARQITSPPFSQVLIGVANLLLYMCAAAS